MFAFFRRLINDIKARHRGEARIFPGDRGRVYAKMPQEILNGPYYRRFFVKPTVSLEIKIIKGDPTL